MPDLKDTSVCGEPRRDGSFCPTSQHPGEVHTLDDGTVFRTVPYAGTAANDVPLPPLSDELLVIAQLRAELRELRADKRWLLAHASHQQFAAFINAKRARTAATSGGAQGSAVDPSAAVEGPDVAAQPAETVDIAAWCRDRMEAFLSWESHEMAMFPSDAEREVAIVEWVVRVLGNPDSADSAEVVRLLAARHEAVSHAA